MKMDQVVVNAWLHRGEVPCTAGGVCVLVTPESGPGAQWALNKCGVAPRLSAMLRAPPTPSPSFPYTLVQLACLLPRPA